MLFGVSVMVGTRNSVIQDAKAPEASRMRDLCYGSRHSEILFIILFLGFFFFLLF